LRTQPVSLQAGQGIAITAAGRTISFFCSCGFVISNCTIAARRTTRLRGKGGIALSPKVVPLEPRNDVVQKLLPSWTPRVSQRQAELISKALRGSEMSPNLFIGVGKEHFDAPLCLGQVVPSEGGGDDHNVAHTLLNFVHGSPSACEAPSRAFAPEGEVLLITRDHLDGSVERLVSVALYSLGMVIYLRYRPILIGADNG
jgi:hypothetical protein